jgi:hypothetical protein
MQEVRRLRELAAKAKRLSGGVGDPDTISRLKAYELDCRMDADAREAEIDNAAWDDAHPDAGASKDAV